jgi:hypothetical protein
MLRVAGCQLTQAQPLADDCGASRSPVAAAKTVTDALEEEA